MTRAECEKKLLDLAEQAMKVYREYNPDGSGIMLHSYDQYIAIYDVLDTDADVEVSHSIDAMRFATGKEYHRDLESRGLKNEDQEWF